MGASTIGCAVNQTIEAIIQKCLHNAIPTSRTNSDWLKISNDFLQYWNFPNCLAAIDGKHVVTFAPKKSGSLYFNYKKSFSYNLMAAVDARYRFIMVDIGAYGSNADSTVFSSSPFGNAWLNNPENLNVPEDAPLPGTTNKNPFVIIGDEGFALKPTILRPYPGHKLSVKERIFNYRLSRARRVVENAFGILSQTWRILLKRLEVKKESAINIILVCCILHNLLRMESATQCETTTSTASQAPVDRDESSVPASSGYDVRSQFADWCVTEGDLDFQYKMI
ncbi:uncharacterized protein LOC129907807 isoform X2 [Episyrphus balteatus]|nr:uncharacterized protein LOC129907807 isoform X2 [Episyrphus balteatus]